MCDMVSIIAKIHCNLEGYKFILMVVKKMDEYKYWGVALYCL